MHDEIPMLLNKIPLNLRSKLSDRNLRVMMNANDDQVELVIYDFIGKDPWSGTGVGAGDVDAFLNANRGKPVNVKINSGGGFAYDGLTIHNALVQHDAPVTTIVMGQAASAAAVIMAAGDPVCAFENATIMIHRALCICMGNRDAMQEMSGWLDQLDDAIARTFGAKAGKQKSEIMKLMTGEGKADGTQMSAKDAQALGLVDKIIHPRGEGNIVVPAPGAAHPMSNPANWRLGKIEAEQTNGSQWLVDATYVPTTEGMSDEERNAAEALLQTSPKNDEGVTVDTTSTLASLDADDVAEQLATIDAEDEKA